MAKKEFAFRGKSLEELQKLSLKEFADLIPSRYRRALSTGLTDGQKKLVDKIAKGKTAKTHIREMVILPQMVGKTVKVFRGNEFVSLIIEPEMMGHYLGEFVLTRKRVLHHAPGLGATKSSGGVTAK